MNSYTHFPLDTYFPFIVTEIYTNSLVRNLKMCVVYLEEETLHLNFNLYRISVSEDNFFFKWARHQLLINMKT